MIFRKKKKIQTKLMENFVSNGVADVVYGLDNTPFFILGCVRSGTTLLRDILRIHPRLESPEETHFFRWADPYASPRYERNYVGVKLFKNHRDLDGVGDFDFEFSRQMAKNRKDISDFYGKYFLQAKNNIDGRWFDKTPQNVYRILLLGYMYPTAECIWHFVVGLYVSNSKICAYISQSTECGL